MPESKFCTKCGCNLSAGINFCPECGMPVPGSKASEDMEKQAAQLNEAVKVGHINMLMFALIIYALPAVITGLFLLLDATHVADAILHNESVIKWASSHGITLTIDNTRQYVYTLGTLELVSGLLAGASMFLVYKRQKRKVATILCFIAACLCCWSIVGMFLGIMVAFMIYGAAECFLDENVESVETN